MLHKYNRIKIVQGDITKIHVDAIVNAANSSLLGGSGVDGMIHKIGGKSILEECIKIRNRQGGCKVGDAVITNAGKLKAKKVIHTVGPKWVNGEKNEELLLKTCYLNCFRLASMHNLKSIAFPNISTGRYSFPKRKAATIAQTTAINYLKETNSPMECTFVCFDAGNYKIYLEIFKLMQSSEDK